MSESYKDTLNKLAKIVEEGKKLRMSNPEITKGWEKSTQRTGYDEQMMKDAIANGQAIGISYQSEGMPVTKFRFVLPVVLGTHNNGTKKLRAYHLKGQSEKVAKKTGSRSAEAAGEWRMFDVGSSKFKGMWLTDKFFNEAPKDNAGHEYTPNDSHFSSKIAVYDPAEARQRQLKLAPAGKAEPIDITKQIQTPVEKPTDVTSDITGYELDEEKKEKNPFYVKKPWLRKKRGRWSRYFQEED